MNIKQLFADEDAVSPVIGVILMVAITVILAAVIGTFVLGLGENVQDSAPQANFQFEYDATGTFDGSDADEDSVTVTHTGGEDVKRKDLKVQIGSATVTDLTNSNTGIATSLDATVSTGSSVTITDNNDVDGSGSPNQFAAGDDVRVIWTSPSGGNSNTIGQSTIPS